VPESAGGKARLHVTFPGHLASEPILHRVASEVGLVTNIQRATIDDRGGWVIVEVDGDDEQLAAAVSWLAERGLDVDRIDE
jgi:ABC-type methionine transport system ATPase subunit